MSINSMYGLIKGTLDKIQNRKILNYFGHDIYEDEVMAKIDKFAFYLNQNGIGKGDVVAICLPNIPSAVYSVYAVNKCGAIANLIHPLTPPLGLLKILKSTNSKMLIYLDSFYIKGLSELKDIKTIICNVADDMPMPLRAFLRLKTRSAGKISLRAENTVPINLCFAAEGEVRVDIDEEDIAVYLHSGGTTGAPKTIMLSNRSLNACADKAGKLVGEFQGNTDAMLMALPLFHGFGLGIAMHTTMSLGCMIILMPKFSGNSAAKIIKKLPVTFIAGVPQMYNKIMDSKYFNGLHLKRLKNIYCGGDKLPKSIKDRWDKLMNINGNNIEILEGYGLTEMLTVTNVNVPGASKPSSVGKPLCGIINKIVDENDKILGANESGQICISGSTIMSGYLNDKESTDEAIRVDSKGVKWVYTGDCGYIDEDGFLFFRERIKRMVKVSGVNVFPQEIEYTVSELSEIKCACALEIDWQDKTAIKLYIVLHDGCIMNKDLENKITDYISERLMKYSVPRIIEQRDSLPLTLVGKVNYMALYNEEMKNGKLKYN